MTDKEVRRDPTPKKLDLFKKKNINRARPPKGYVESVLARRNNRYYQHGWNRRLQRTKDPSTVQIWKEVAKEFLTIISNTPTTTSNISITSAVTSLQNSVSSAQEDSDEPLQNFTFFTEEDNEDNEEDTDDNFRVVTTSLRQIIRDERNLADIEQQLSSEQRANHQVFQAFSRVLQEATDMVNFYAALL